MDKEIEKLINERQQLTNKLCFEIINFSRGKTKINLKNVQKN